MTVESRARNHRDIVESKAFASAIVKHLIVLIKNAVPLMMWIHEALVAFHLSRDRETESSLESEICWVYWEFRVSRM